MPKLRTAVILMLLALIAVGLGGLALMDPIHLRHIRWYTAGAILVAIVLVTAAFAAVARRGLLRGFVLVVGGVCVVGWLAMVWLASQAFGDEGTAVREVVDGDRRLVVLEQRPSIDTAYAVVVRSGSGPFEQESTVYQGLEEAPAPTEVRFVDSDTVEVTVGTGCTYRSEIEPFTLAVDVLHQPLQLNTC